MPSSNEVPKIVLDHKDVQCSKSLSWLLRHGAIKEGFQISPDGYLSVDEVLKHKAFRGKYKRADIERVVQSNDKQRFKLRVNPDTNVLEIRANQGHSITEVSESILTPILEMSGKVTKEHLVLVTDSIP
ncbi:tRNA 2'-phosphotransferase 1 [Plodia interpunctella]|uniref:tRNA 2'-phosphotransferase 1 n=1 Tax=Plodia interpunctella TaxID=58824 RepID=UPI0023682730|nr:tRNA 2'-phosphotransferase 1 [Plodia interpunctella]